VTFDKDAEPDPQLSGIALSALFARYEQQFEGDDLIGKMPSDDSKVAARITKAVKAAFADLETLVEAVPSEGGEDVPGDVGNDKLLLEMYWRLHDGWKATEAPTLKMVDVAGNTPSWTDVAALFGELAALDHDGGDGDSFPAEWYEELLGRYEARLGKDKPKKKATPKKAAIAIKEPPPGAEILDYSPKSTFYVDQWVRHPKFGVGIVIEAAQHVTLEFAGERKVLTHIAAIAAPLIPKSRPKKPAGNTLELARAAGVDIKKVPGRFDEEK
jgi:hypothetical protein